jgi:transposase
LRALVKARKALLDLKTRLQSQNEHAAPGQVQKAHARILKSLASEIAGLEAAISAQIKASPHLAERAEIIESVPGFAIATRPHHEPPPERGGQAPPAAAALVKKMRLSARSEA